MIAGNLWAWSLQIAALVAVGTITAAILQLRVPAARLLFWQVVLAGCLALPLVGPWKREVIADSVSVTTMAFVRSVPASGGVHIPPERVLLLLIAAGVLARAAQLSAGFWKLRQYRRRSHALEDREGTTLLISSEISSPVTFGAFRPVVLLPSQFPELDPKMREAILCHELAHVRRRDWAFTVAEELVRSALWFHPAIWWLLGQIQLAREQAVDREVIEKTRSREEYVDALLAIAGATPQLDLAPAPLFLRQRHLKQRVVSILTEVRMSKTRLISSLAAAFGVLGAAGWLITATFPLAAAPQTVADSPGVTVDLNGATLLHRAPVLYPEAARKQGVQGTVVVQVRIDGSGNVSDAQVLSGPDELRKTVLQSVLNWHFTRNFAGVTSQATVGFSLSSGDLSAVVGPAPTAAAATPVAAVAAERTVKSISLVGLSEESRADLLSRLPVHEGDSLSPESLRQLVQTVRSFDEHLVVTTRPLDGGSAALYIIVPQAPAAAAPPAVEAPPTSTPPAHIRVGGNVQAVKLVFQPKPTYPREAKEARVQGKVSLHALIGKDGTVQNLTVISGDPLLVPSALDAVRQWVYQPTLLNGEPVGVDTQIDVNYTLSQ